MYLFKEFQKKTYLFHPQLVIVHMNLVDLIVGEVMYN